MFLSHKMMLTTSILLLVVAGAQALLGEPFLRYDPIQFQTDDECSHDEEIFEELGVDFLKMPESPKKGKMLAQYVSGLLRRRQLHLKSGQYVKPSFTSGFLDLWLPPSPEVSKYNSTEVTPIPDPQRRIFCECDLEKPAEVKTVSTANTTEPKIFFNLLLTYENDIHYIFFFVIEHDYNILTNLYYLRS